METPAELYLDLLKKCLTRYLFEDTLVPYNPWESGSTLSKRVNSRLASRFRRNHVEMYQRVAFDRKARENGRDWPSEAETMIGLKRLDNLQNCLGSILADKIPGDLIETGVWRGGAAIFMRAVLAANGDKSRIVWCADSFRGLPTPSVSEYPADAIAPWHKAPQLAVSLEQVKANFRRYGVLDEQVRFLEGWFKDTLPVAPIDKLALIRLDGDMYESTMDALKALYDKLSVGGFLIIDDYGLPEDTCRRAIHDYRSAHGITEPIVDIDGWGAFWRRTT